MKIYGTLALFFVIILLALMPIYVGYDFNSVRISLEYSLLPWIVKESTIPFLVAYAISLFLLYLFGSKKEKLVAVFLALTTLYAIIPLSQYPIIFGDQPRLEVKASIFAIERGLHIENLVSVSNYFRYPSAWLFIGAFSSITALDPWLCSQVLTLIGWIIISATLYIFQSKASKHGLLSAATHLLLFMAAPQAYRTYFCPQLYGFILFSLYFFILRPWNSSYAYILTCLICLFAVVSSHPITYVFIISVELVLLLSVSLKLFSLTTSLMYLLIVFVTFMAWQTYIARGDFTQSLNYLKDIILGEVRPEIGHAFKKTNIWYTIMSYYRYSIYTLIATLSIFTVMRHHRTFPIKYLVIIVLGVFLAGIILIATPGGWFDRTVMFGLIVAALMASFSLPSPKRKLLSQSTIFLLFLSLVPSFLGFVALGNPYLKAYLPSYDNALKFTASHITKITHVGAVGMLSYHLFPDIDNPSEYVHLFVDSMSSIRNLTPENIFLVYNRYPLNIVSLKERAFLPSDKLWKEVDRLLSLNYSVVYSNKVNYIVYRKK